MRLIDPWYGLIFFLYTLYALLPWAMAQTLTVITPDGSLGSVVSQSGRVHTITGGTVRGPNLFHSFERFDVGAGDQATFTGPATVEHILSRVIGRSPSMIDGGLGTDILGADLYLLNPSGVVFGPNARLDVQGSFHVSTADGVRLADGGHFSATIPEQSVLTLAAPSAFGFLHETPSRIRVERSPLILPEHETLSIIGGDIEITRSFLVALSGRINIASIASPGDVNLNASELNLDAFSQLGEVAIMDLALLNTSNSSEDAGGGTITIRGGCLLIDASFFFVTTGGDVDGASIGIDIEVKQDVTIANGAFVTSATVGSGDAGDVRLNADTFVITNSTIDTRVDGGSGNAGDFTVRAGVLTIAEGAQIGSGTFLGTGQSGEVTVIVSDTLTITGSDPNDSTFPSGIFSQADPASSGAANEMSIEASRLIIADGGTISSSAFGTGEGGNVTVRVSDTLTITGTDPEDRSPSGIFAQTVSAGPDTQSAGDVLIETPRLIISDGGEISSSTFGAGQSGDVTVRVSDVLMITGADPTDGSSSGIFAQTNGASSGAAGTILIEAPQLIIADGGQISSDTLGTGRGGNVTVQVRDMLTITGSNSVNDSSSRISVSTFGSGVGGDVSVDARQIQLTGGAVIEARSTQSGDAGDIHIQADQLRLDGQSSIQTEALSANGGNITISAPSLVRLQNSTITATVSGGPDTTGGDIDMTADVVLLLGSDVRADAFEGRGGRVSIEATALFQDPESRVSASSEVGIDGTVAINTIVSELRELARLPDAFAIADGLQNRCAIPLQSGVVSRFFARRSTGIPAAPGGLLPGLIDMASLELTSAAPVANATAELVSPLRLNILSRGIALDGSSYTCLTQ